MTAPPASNAPANDFTAACVQMSSGDDVGANLARAAELLAQAAKQGAQLAALPEFFPVLSADENCKLKCAEQFGAGPIQDFLKAAAQEHNMHILGGALPIYESPSRVYASSLLIAPSGEVMARYDKMHLFRFTGKRATADETKTIAPGKKPVAVDTEFGKMALSICYDLRFPELYRSLSPDIIFAPSAFTEETGRAHWEVLLRARAIENLAHIIAPAQCGTHPGGRRTHGNSMIIDPWGEITARADNKTETIITATISATTRQQHRQRLPSLSHRLI